MIHQFLHRNRQLLAFIFVVFIACVAVVKINDRAINRSNELNRQALTQDREAQVKACLRVQRLRDQQNGLTFIAFDSWQAAYNREIALSHTEADPKIHIQSAKQLQKTIETLIVIGPTDCRTAVYHPDEYNSPRPIQIYRDGPAVDIIRERAKKIIKQSYPITNPAVTDVQSN